MHKFDYFFLSTLNETKHEGPLHTHFSIFPTNNEVLSLLELNIPSVNPKLLYKVINILNEHSTSQTYIKIII